MEGSSFGPDHLNAGQYDGHADGGQVDLDGGRRLCDQPQVRRVQARMRDRLCDVGHASAAHQKDDEAAGRQQDDPKADREAAKVGAG